MPHADYHLSDGHRRVTPLGKAPTSMPCLKSQMRSTGELLVMLRMYFSASESLSCPAEKASQRGRLYVAPLSSRKE